jgi:hypothetical protein
MILLIIWDFINFYIYNFYYFHIDPTNLSLLSLISQRIIVIDFDRSDENKVRIVNGGGRDRTFGRLDLIIEKSDKASSFVGISVTGVILAIDLD